jgi:hypothetical protein
MIDVVNIRYCDPNSRHKVIAIDRATALGNPFVMKSESERMEVLAKYRRWLWERMKDPGSAQMKQLREILEIERREGDVLLGCWCSPKACHGDFVKKALTWMKSQK